MFLKPSEFYPEGWSEPKKLFETKKGYWTVKEYYGYGSHFDFEYWEYVKELYDDYEAAFWRKKIQIPLSLSGFYIQFIYRHLGKCHPDLRSKYYIGKARK